MGVLREMTSFQRKARSWVGTSGARPETSGDSRSGSARRPCWPRPCDALRRASSWRRPAFGGLHQFVGQTLGHRLLAALARRFLHPVHGQRRGDAQGELQRHLEFAPPTRRDLTSTIGFTLFSAMRNTSSGSLPGASSRPARARRRSCARRLPSCRLHDDVHELGQIDRLPNFGSGRISRLGTSRRRGISLFLLCFSWREPSSAPRSSHTRPSTYSASACGTAAT